MTGPAFTSSVTIGCYTAVNYYSILDAKNAISKHTTTHLQAEQWKHRRDKCKIDHDLYQVENQGAIMKTIN